MRIDLDCHALEKAILDFKEEYAAQRSVFVTCFPQLWGSTALGYGLIGGSAMTTSHTLILGPTMGNICSVSFDGGERIAYIVQDPTEKFFEDVKNQNMKSVHDLLNSNDYGKILWIFGK